ncbi:MAG: tRNA (5-methylaminomethyl-2-thiouridine)(34)-methyltransferase MnmD [Bacteroidetes bacterium]|nr:tRNA (5-methylaminomethyl-2-thiouridine)(34)-methyltransferase MnmD [Bacteroidota bacterium]
MENLSFVLTSDGSRTLFNEEVGEHYHSKNGAVQESIHVFLNTGLRYFIENTRFQEISILELGFGTGLNFLISAEYCLKNKIALDYTGIEAYPLREEMIVDTGYESYVSENLWNSFISQYTQGQKTSVSIEESCLLKIVPNKLLEFNSQRLFDVIYFDAFAAIHQPEMWNQESLKHISKYLKTGGVFVTYAITGDLKRTMKGLGFTIEKVPGAAGKREMLRAIKM